MDSVSKPCFIRRADDINADWMTRALAPRFPGVAVTYLERLDCILGAQTKLRVRLGYNAAGRDAGLPELMIVKADIEEFGLGPVADVLFNEPRVYRDLLPLLDIVAPRIWAAEPGDAGPSYTVMEDLKASGVRFLNLADPVTPQIAADFLTSLARLHARWWNSPDLADDGCFAALRQPVIGRFETYVRGHLAPDRFAHFASLPRAAATAKSLRDPGRLLDGLLRLREFHRGMPVCVVHGDTHLNNLYLTAAGEPGFYDWSPRRTAWSNDIAYFLPAALDVPDRRRHEKRLLRHYLRQLGKNGVAAPDFATAWLAYRRELIWGLFIFLINGPTQTEYANTAATARFAVAMLDHDTNRLLGV